MRGAMDWHCVRIEHMRLTRPLNETFRNLLIEEYAEMGQPDTCRVYVRADPGGGYAYFFSPGASRHFQEFLAFWKSVALAEPTNLLNMEVVI
jgi:hypothetical protein